MLFLPQFNYEGSEMFENIFYTGAFPNQQLSLRWAVADGHLRRVPRQEVYLVGSDTSPKNSQHDHPRADGKLGGESCW